MVGGAELRGQLARPHQAPWLRVSVISNPRHLRCFWFGVLLTRSSLAFLQATDPEESLREAFKVSGGCAA